MTSPFEVVDHDARIGHTCRRSRLGGRIKTSTLHQIDGACVDGLTHGIPHNSKTLPNSKVTCSPNGTVHRQEQGLRAID